LRVIIMTRRCSRLLLLGTLLASAGPQLGKSQMDGISAILKQTDLYMDTLISLGKVLQLFSKM